VGVVVPSSKAIGAVVVFSKLGVKGVGETVDATDKLPLGNSVGKGRIDMLPCPNVVTVGSVVGGEENVGSVEVVGEGVASCSKGETEGAAVPESIAFPRLGDAVPVGSRGDFEGGMVVVFGFDESDKASVGVSVGKGRTNIFPCPNVVTVGSIVGTFEVGDAKFGAAVGL